MSAPLIVALAGLALLFVCGPTAGLFAWVGAVRDAHGTLSRRGRRAIVRAVALGIVGALLGVALVLGGSAVAIVAAVAGH